MAVDIWRSYVAGGHFVIKIDHKSHLEDQVLSSDLQRKAMTKLVGPQFKFQFKKGVDNKAAATVSRVGHVFALQAISTGQPVWLQEILNSYVVDNEAQVLLQKLRQKCCYINFLCLQSQSHHSHCKMELSNMETEFGWEQILGCRLN